MRSAALLAAAAWAASSFSAFADVKMPGIFSDHMVLQSGKPVPVWGWATPNETVVVEFGGQRQCTEADAHGAWKVTLNPLAVSAIPGSLSVSGHNVVTFHDVVVGEVWFCSGQSNMEWAVDGHPVGPANPVLIPCDTETQQLVGDGDHPLVRISAHTRDTLKTPGGGWVPFSKSIRAILPALPGCTALLLHQRLNVPVGVIVRCESSAPACFFMRRDVVANDLGIQKQLAAYSNEYPPLQAKYQTDLAAWQSQADAAKAEGKPEPRKPRPLDPPGLCVSGDGIARDLVGARYSSKIEPVVGYAIRGFLWDQGENGTGIGGADMTTVLPALLRSWRDAWAEGALPMIYLRKNQHPAGLESAMSALAPTAMVDNRGLGQELHPLDKAAYARRIVERMWTTAYGK